MNYSNRSYPHPVIGIRDNYSDQFEVKLSVSANIDKIKIKPVFILENMELLDLLNEKRIVFCMQVYCKGTHFRKAYNFFKKTPPPVEISSTQLNELVDLDFLICAYGAINDYGNKSFGSDYAGNTFSLDAGDIMGYGGKAQFFANKSFEELKSVSSFMNIDCGEKETMPMYNNYDGDKITITLSKSSYELYQQIKSERTYINTLHSSIVLPALAEAIRFINTEEAGDYSGSKWYVLLEKLVASNQTDDPLQTAQKILDFPVNRSFNSLQEMMI